MLIKHTSSNEQVISIEEKALQNPCENSSLCCLLCFSRNIYLFQESKMAFLISLTRVLLKRHRALSAKVRDKLQNPYTSFAGEHLPPQQPAVERLNGSYESKC